MAEVAKLQTIGSPGADIHGSGGADVVWEECVVKTTGTNSAVLSQDFHRLMEAFTNEIRLAVPCDGIKYRADDVNQHFVSGVLDHYLCCFEIKVGDKSFGNIYFARETQFLDSELLILENMVAGLVLPLCHLFQEEISNENIQDSEHEELVVTSAACNKQA